MSEGTMKTLTGLTDPILQDDFETVVKEDGGKGSPLTVGTCWKRAALFQEEGKEETAAGKFDNFLLAQRIHNAIQKEEDLPLKNKEVETLTKLAGIAFPPLILGQMMNLIKDYPIKEEDKA